MSLGEAAVYILKGACIQAIAFLLCSLAIKTISEKLSLLKLTAVCLCFLLPLIYLFDPKCWFVLFGSQISNIIMYVRLRPHPVSVDYSITDSIIKKIQYLPQSSNIAREVERHQQLRLKEAELFALQLRRENDKKEARLLAQEEIELQSQDIP
jgi:hypothetical protein